MRHETTQRERREEPLLQTLLPKAGLFVPLVTLGTTSSGHFLELGQCPNGPTVTFIFGDTGRTMNAGIGPRLGPGIGLLQAPSRIAHLV